MSDNMIEDGKKNAVNIAIYFLRSWSQILYLYISYCDHDVTKKEKKFVFYHNI